MNFGQAIEAVKAGARVARSGWNGKGMFIYLNPGACESKTQVFRHGHGFDVINNVRANLFETGDDGIVTRMPSLNMRAADGSIVTGWLASQTDMLAEDWSLVYADSSIDRE